MTQIITIFTVDSDPICFVYFPQISPNTFSFYFLTSRLTHTAQTLLKATKQSAKIRINTQITNKDNYNCYKDINTIRSKISILVQKLNITHSILRKNKIQNNLCKSCVLLLD